MKLSACGAMRGSGVHEPKNGRAFAQDKHNETTDAVIAQLKYVRRVPFTRLG
jgi:hypothetical protein